MSPGMILNALFIVMSFMLLVLLYVENKGSRSDLRMVVLLVMVWLVFCLHTTAMSVYLHETADIVQKHTDVINNNADITIRNSMILKSLIMGEMMRKNPLARPEPEIKCNPFEAEPKGKTH